MRANHYVYKNKTIVFLEALVKKNCRKKSKELEKSKAKAKDFFLAIFRLHFPWLFATKLS